MRQRTINILVFISLAFNLAFVGMFLYHRIHFERGRPPFSDRHAAPPFFKDNFRDVMKECEAERREFHQASRKFFIMLTSDDMDDEILRTQLDSVLTSQFKFQQKMGEGMIQTHHKLSPKQLEEAREFLKKRKKGMKKDNFKSERERRKK